MGGEAEREVMNWNDSTNEFAYNNTVQHAKEKGFSEDELKLPYMLELRKSTKSKRISRMISHAYYLGMLRGIRDADDWKGHVAPSGR